MIRVENIYKSFNNTPVLQDVSMFFEKGQTNLIIGQSGSGKTVLMKCLVGLLEADAGNIFYDDRNFSAMRFRQRKVIRKELGMLFQGSALFDSMTVEQNIMFPLDMFTNMTRKEKQKRAQFCLDRVNLHNVEHLLPAELSGGMKKRVAIARAISNKPKYLFCDEPNSGLDPPTAILIDKLISEITKELNITTVVNTHDMNSVMEIGDFVTYIYKGKLWWTGDRNKILHTDNAELNNFVYATELMRTIKHEQ
jgi:phospholipid/cholesterol/gamma-HCH transport system ATP-binding protein